MKKSGLDGSLPLRLWGGALWNLVGAVFNQGSTFLVGLAAAHHLGREGFGAYGAVVSTISTVTGIASLGIAFTATRYVARFRVANPARAGRVAGLCLACSLLAAAISSTILVLFAPMIGGRILHRTDLVLLLDLGAVASFCSVVNQTQTGLLAGLEEFGSIARAGALGGTLYFLLGGAGLFVFGLPGVIGGIALSGLAQAAILASLVRRAPGIRLSLGLREEWHTLREFALPAALPGLTYMPGFWIATMLLLQRPDGYSQVAMFVAANNLRILVLFVPSMVSSVSLSMMNAEVGRGERNEFSRALRVALQAAVSAAALGVLVGGLASRPLMTLFGRSFADGQAALIALVASVLPEVVCTVLGQVLATHERMWTSLFVLAIPRDLGFVICAVALAPRFGAAGVAVGYAAAALYSAVAAAALVLRSGLAAPLAVGRA